MPARLCVVLSAVLAVGVGTFPAFALPPPKNPAYADPAQTDADFPFQGEYAGTLTQDGRSEPFGVQVIALGDGSFDAVGYPGGLPGDGWKPPTKLRGTGKRDGDVVNLTGLELGGLQRPCRIKDGALTVLDASGSTIARFSKVTRKSPTLGQPAPKGAIVIFDGAGPADETATLVNPQITADGLLMEGVTSHTLHGDATVHVEFRLPYQPKDRGQARGNSGVYLSGAYEVQMLDSFGLEGKNNECGGIYSVAAPAVNMCLPPLEWQTYDIEFTAPRFDGEKKVKDATMTVRHNGVLIHENAAVPKITPSGPQTREQPTGPLYLQNHGNPVRYRNIWVQPKS